MREFFSTLNSQFRELWQNFNNVQRAAVIGVPVLAVIVIIALVIALPDNYQVLFTNMTQSDLMLIEQKLSATETPFQVDRTDNSIRIRPEDRDMVVLMLAGEGLPHGQVEGYSLFERQKLGATEFEQRTNYKIAMEQELQRTIQTFENVRTARVMLVLPQPTVFTERKKPTTASIALSLKGAIPSDQVRAIQHYVSNAVEGLDPEDISITDGVRELTRRQTAVGAMTNEQQAFRDLAEESREEKIMAQLSEIYGNRLGEVLNPDAQGIGDKITSLAKPVVTAEFDHDTQDTEITTYDPEAVVGNEHTVSESSEGVPLPTAAGVPGVTSHIMGAGNVQGSGSYTKEESTTEYQTGVTREVRSRTPKLTSLATSVVVNSNILNSLEGTPERTQEETTIRNLVAAAIGYPDPTGIISQPTVEFISFPPQSAPFVPIEAPTVWWKNPLTWIAAALALAALAALALLLKPRFGRREEADEEGIVPGVDEGELQQLLERQRDALEEEELEGRRRRRQALIDLADANPEEIEKVMRHWGDAE